MAAARSGASSSTSRTTTASPDDHRRRTRTRLPDRRGRRARANGDREDPRRGGRRLGTYRWRDNYVITEDHYIDYLSRSPVESLVPIQILDKLRDSHCLFLGYTMRDWNLRVFLKRIWGGQQLAAKSLGGPARPRHARHASSGRTRRRRSSRAAPADYVELARRAARSAGRRPERDLSAVATPDPLGAVAGRAVRRADVLHRGRRAIFFGRDAERKVLIAQPARVAADAAVRRERRRKELAAARGGRPRGCGSSRRRHCGARRTVRNVPVVFSSWRDEPDDRADRRDARSAIGRLLPEAGADRPARERGLEDALEPPSSAHGRHAARDPRPVRGVLPLPTRSESAPGPVRRRARALHQPARSPRELPDRDPRGRLRRSRRPVQGPHRERLRQLSCTSTTSTERRRARRSRGRSSA